jgi:LytR cell envelope-related transcriptional attenuator
VDHSSRLPTAQPWRSAAFIAAAVATVELVILLVAGIFLFGKFFAAEVEKASDPAAVAQAAVERQAGKAGGSGEAGAKPLLERRKTVVLVLNGNGVPGAAGTTADRVRARHYVVAGTGNAPRTTFARSVVMYRPGFEGEARRLGRDLRIRHVTPLDGMRVRDLQGAHVALVVGG